MNSARQQTTEQFSPGWLAVTFLFWLGNVVLHLEFSNWLVRPYSTPLGEFIPRDLSVHAAVISALLTAALLWKRIARGEARLAHGITWVLWSITAASAFLLLMTTPIEAIHYLQYGILAFLLASALDPDKQQWPLTTLLFITVGLGIIDELNQYFLLTPGNSTYIDFNDFVLNMLGAQAGLFAYYAGLQHDRPPRPGTDSTHAAQITLAAYMLLALIILLLLLLGRLAHSPPVSVPPGGILTTGNMWTIFIEREAGLLESWQTSFDGGQYYVLGIVGGTVTLGLLALSMLAFTYATQKSDTV